MGLPSFDVVFAVFCRLGCCFMVLPGISSPRVPQAVRLFLALGFSLAVAPLLAEQSIPRHVVSLSLETAVVLGKECATGFAIGLLARMIFGAIQIAGAVIALVSGYSHVFTTDDGQGDPAFEIASLVGTAVVVLLFTLDLHHVVISSLVASYQVVGFGLSEDTGFAVERLTSAASAAMSIALGMAAPFVLVSFIVNLAFGMLNRMAPQIPVVFISTAFLIGAMLWLSGILISEMANIAVKAVFGSVSGL